MYGVRSPQAIDTNMRFTRVAHNTLTLALLSINFSDSLSVLATESLRLEKFSPFILDATSPDTPWLISAYLKVRVFK